MTEPKKDFEKTTRRYTPAQADVDMANINAAMEQFWLNANGKEKDDMTMADRINVAEFTTQYKRIAYRALLAYEQENGEDCYNKCAHSFQCLSDAIAKALMQHIETQPKTGNARRP